jgi:hypothetical protein
MQKESSQSPSSAEVLQRIQDETQRVRSRLSDDSDKSQVSYSPTKSIKREPSLQDFIIEPSESSYFEDPVPAQNNMSDHLKSQHEAFKARYVTLRE